jgi:hypothetical protein
MVCDDARPLLYTPWTVWGILLPAPVEAGAFTAWGWRHVYVYVYVYVDVDVDVDVDVVADAGNEKRPR